MRKAILTNCDSELIKTLSEIALNAINGNINLNKTNKQYLAKFKRHLRKLACVKKTISEKRKILVQSGGFLPTLLSALLTSVLSNVLN